MRVSWGKSFCSEMAWMAFAFSKSRKTGEISRNTSTPAMISPLAFRIGATVTCTGILWPSFLLANTSGTFAADAGDNRAMERAVFLAAELVAVLIDVAKNVIEALATYDVGTPPTGDPLGCLVPIGDLAIHVGDVDPIAQ